MTKHGKNIFVNNDKILTKWWWLWWCRCIYYIHIIPFSTVFNIFVFHSHVRSCYFPQSTI